MQSNRHRDTAPEMAVRRLLHAQGLRYRVDIRPVKEIRRRADIVFPKQRIAVFIDGCFWHGCEEHGSRTFGINAAYWTPKIAGNMARDADTSTRLEEAGWSVLRFWEHTSPDAVAGTIAEAVSRSR